MKTRRFWWDVWGISMLLVALGLFIIESWGLIILGFAGALISAIGYLSTSLFREQKQTTEVSPE